MTRKEAIEIIRNYDVNGCGYCHQGGEEVEEAFDMAIQALEQDTIPNLFHDNQFVLRMTEPKKGHWVGVDQYPHEDYECDMCGYVVYADEDTPDKYNYCPNCGADMRGDGE